MMFSCTPGAWDATQHHTLVFPFQEKNCFSNFPLEHTSSVNTKDWVENKMLEHVHGSDEPVRGPRG